MPLNAAIQRIQRLMGFNGVLTDRAGGSAQTYLSNRFRPVRMYGETPDEDEALVWIVDQPGDE